MGLRSFLDDIAPHRQQRDGAAWSVEWHALPQLCMATAKALELAVSLAQELRPDPAAGSSLIRRR